MPLRAAALPVLSIACLLGCSDRHAWELDGWRPDAPPVRVVLGSVLAAESLLSVLPAERLAGAHEFAADPGYSLVAGRARGVPLVGSTPEALLSARPDLVLVDAYTRAETLALLAAAGVPVVRTVDPHGFDDIETNLRMLGRVTHLEDEVGAVADAMRAELGQVAKVAEEMPDWRLLSLDGALHTYGEGSLFDAIVRIKSPNRRCSSAGSDTHALTTYVRAIVGSSRSRTSSPPTRRSRTPDAARVVAGIIE